MLCIEHLHGHCQSIDLQALHRPGQPYPLGSSAGPIITGIDLLASVGNTTGYLFLAAAKQNFLQVKVGSHNWPIVWFCKEGNMLQRVADRGCVHMVAIMLLPKSYSIVRCSVLQPLRQQYAILHYSSVETVTLSFAHPDHVQAFILVLFDLILLSVCQTCQLAKAL